MKIFSFFFLAVCSFAQIVQPGAGGGGSTTDASALTTGTLSAARLPTSAVQNNQSNTYSTGTQNFSGAQHTLPAVKGLNSAKPATCTQGEIYFATDATAGQNLYYCTATNTWTQASGGSSATPGRVLLESHTASSSATLDFTTRNATGQSGATFQSDYDEYVIEFQSLVPATNATFLNLAFSSNDGSTWDTTLGHYIWQAYFFIFSAAAPTGDNNAAGIVIAQAVSNSAIDGGATASATVYNPLSTTTYTRVHFMASALSTNNSSNLDAQIGSANYKQTTGSNSFRVSFGSGAIASGTVRVYGISK